MSESREAREKATCWPMTGNLEYDEFVQVSHLPKLLVDDSKLEGVVDFMFVIRYYQLGSLYKRNGNNLLLNCFNL